MEEDVELEQSDSETNGSSVSYYKWCRHEKKIQKMLLTIDQRCCLTVERIHNKSKATHLS